MASSSESTSIMRVLFAVVFVFLQSTPGSTGEQLSAQTFPLYEKEIKNLNEPASLNCSVSSGWPIKSFTWTKNYERLKYVNNSAGPIYWLGLEVNGTETSGGLYKCTVINKDNETDSAEVAVHVKGKPQIIEDPSKFTRSPQATTVNDNVKLHCYATGYPRPQLQWLRNGVKITKEGAPQRDHELIKEDNGLGLTLSITEIQKEDNKVHYTCVAANMFGNATRTIAVYVKDPEPSYLPHMKAKSPRMSASVGDRNVTLECTANYARQGQSATFWEFKGKQYDVHSKPNASQPGQNYHVRDEYKKVEKGPHEVKTSLIIDKVSELDLGNFTCGVSTTATSDHPAVDYVYLSLEDTHEPSAKQMKVALTIGLVVSAVLILGIIAVAVVYYLWSRQQQRRKNIELAQKYDIDGNRFQKDVFITYSSQDYDWVEKVLVPLFEKHKVRYIIHSRDFELGKPIAENMADCVYQSRKVLVVMSMNYIGSAYCNAELQMALQRSMEQDQSSCVVVIRIDDMKKNKIPKSLRHKTFLDYTSREEKNTWEQRLLENVKVPESFHEISGETPELHLDLEGKRNSCKLDETRNQNVEPEEQVEINQVNC